MAPLMAIRSRAQFIPLLCAVGALFAGSRARAQEIPSLLESSVKAAYLYKFSGYVEWPPACFESATAPLVFGVIGDPEVADELERQTKVRSPGQRPVTVMRLRAFDHLPPIHVLFIGRSQADRLSALIRTAHERPILVITDTEHAVAQGSMINFNTIEGHVRFEVGLGAARQARLTLSSRLLAVAVTVDTRNP
jgi:hypothetical protein